jgi:carbamoyl-phosphate synthase large subunit
MAGASRPNVLILSAGRRVELLEGFRSAAKAVALEVRILAADANPGLSAACAVADKALPLPRVSSNQYRDALAQLCRDEGVGLVVPTIDTELAVLAEMRDEFARNGTHLVISDAALVAACRDKRRTAEVFKGIGVDSPTLYSPDAIGFPCFAKPYDGSSSTGARMIAREEDLTASDRANPKLMFMELVAGENVREYTVDAYFDREGTMRAMVPRLRIETRAGEVSKGVTRRGELAEWLRPRLAKLAGARGGITVQLFADESRAFYRAIEINPRFGGGYPLALAAGADFPRWLLEEYLLQRQPSWTDDWQADLLMLRYDGKVLIDASRQSF